jgi:hypothetical protein
MSDTEEHDKSFPRENSGATWGSAAGGARQFYHWLKNWLGITSNSD